MAAATRCAMLSIALLLSSCTYPADAPRFLPAFREGRPIGLAVHSIEPRTRWSTHGVRNGDIILRIEDIELTSPDRMLEAYSKLKDARRVRTELERKGLRRRLETSVVWEPRSDRRFAEVVDDLVRWQRAIEETRARTGAWPTALTRIESKLEELLGFEDVHVADAVDPWGRAYRWVPPAREIDAGCLFSLGPDRELGSGDDIRLACDLDVLNPILLADAAAYGRTDRLDAYGVAISIRSSRARITAWSLGPDGRADTADDQVAVIDRPAEP